MKNKDWEKEFEQFIDYDADWKGIKHFISTLLSEQEDINYWCGYKNGKKDGSEEQKKELKEKINKACGEPLPEGDFPNMSPREAYMAGVCNVWTAIDDILKLL